MDRKRICGTFFARTGHSRRRERNGVQLAVYDAGDFGVERKTVPLLDPNIPETRHRLVGNADDWPFRKTCLGGEVGEFVVVEAVPSSGAAELEGGLFVRDEGQG